MRNCGSPNGRKVLSAVCTQTHKFLHAVRCNLFWAAALIGHKVLWKVFAASISGIFDVTHLGASGVSRVLKNVKDVEGSWQNDFSAGNS